MREGPFTSEALTKLLLPDEVSPTWPGLRSDAGRLEGIPRWEILRRRKNSGAEQTLDIGLANLYEKTSAGRVLIVAADGDDRPQDLSRLLQNLEANSGSSQDHGPASS